MGPLPDQIPLKLRKRLKDVEKASKRGVLDDQLT
jgi:hypothetical protein